MFTDTDEKETDEVSNYVSMDHELFKLLENDLEKYMNDQKKDQKLQWKRQQETGADYTHKNASKELRLFMADTAQIKRDWISLKKNSFQSWFERYEKNLEEKYDSNDANIYIYYDSEK